MIIQLRSTRTGNIYNANVGEITEEMTAQQGDVLTSSTFERTAVMNYWKWYNEDTKTALFTEVNSSYLLSMLTSRGWPFHPPFSTGAVGDAPLLTDIVSIMKLDYAASGLPYKAKYKPGANVNPINDYNISSFEIVMTPDYSGYRIVVSVGIALLDGAEQYYTDGTDPTAHYYTEAATNDPACVCNVLGWLAIVNPITGATYDLSTIDRHGTNNVLDHSYEAGTSGCASIGNPEFYLIFNAYEKFHSNVFGKPDEVIPTLYMATPQKAEQDNLSETSELRLRGPAMNMLAMGDGVVNAIATQSSDTDPLGLPDLSHYIGINNTGMAAIYSMTIAQLQELGKWMWDKSLTAAIRDFFTNVSDAVISMHVLPLSNAEVDLVPSTVKFASISSGVMANMARNIVKKDCGTITINQTFNDFLDYNTTLTLYLPYVGYNQIDVNRFMGHTVGVTYYIDVFTGSAIAFVVDTENNEVYQQYTCDMARQLPLTSNGYGDVIRNLLTATSALAGGAIGARTALTPNGAAAAKLTSYGEALGAGISAAASFATGSVQVLNGISSAPAQLGQQYPILFIDRPIKATTGANTAIIGQPATNSVQLSSLSGFAQVSHPQITAPIPDADYTEIRALLESGVIF